MKKLFSISILAIFASFLSFFSYFSTNTYALAKFNTSYQVYYAVQSTGNTHVTFVITQKNNLSLVYAIEFGISLNETKLSNLKVTDEGVSVVNPTVVKNENQTVISFPFARKVVGKDKLHNFVIEYDTSDIVTKQGNTWQISIPRFESDENVSDQTAILKLPEKFPQPAYIDPKPDIVNGSTYYFSSKILANKPISAIFGNNQYYKGNIKYFLHNPTSIFSEQTITLLPNTPYQSVYYEKIEPFPKKIESDPDGNLIAFYDLKPNQEISITAKVFVKTDFLPRLNTSTKNYPYTEATNIWNFDNNIFTIPDTKNLTSPKSIYDYVANKLKYDYQKINTSGTKRVPASESLKNFLSAICTDYTDLFVSLARKANIPARELEGYAISENPDLRPISSKQDVLHAWPEYFDEAKSSWIQVDPTWGSTTRGLDYFNKLDFNHIVFAIHGIQPDLPLPAGSFKKEGSKEKDISFEAIEEIVFPKNQLEVILANFNPQSTSFIVKNLGGVYFNGPVVIEGSDTVNYFSESLNIPPFGSKKITVKNKTLNFFLKPNTEVIIRINDQFLPVKTTPQGVLQKGGLFAGAGLVLGALTLLTRRLLLRRQK